MNGAITFTIRIVNPLFYCNKEQKLCDLFYPPTEPYERYTLSYLAYVFHVSQTCLHLNGRVISLVGFTN